jgi:hypothetical protein
MGGHAVILALGGRCRRLETFVLYSKFQESQSYTLSSQKKKIIIIKIRQAGCRWLTPVILATWEAEIRRIAI